MWRASDDETCLAIDGHLQLVVAVCGVAVDQLVVARLRNFIYGGRGIVDVDTEALSVFAGVSFVEYGVCVGYVSGVVRLPRAYCLDAVVGHSPHHGRLLLRHSIK